MNSLYYYIEENTKQFSVKPAIIFKDTKITYEELNDFTKKVRAWVLNNKIDKGHIGFIFLPQTPNALMWFFGLMSAGIIPSFMPLPSHKQDKKKYWESHKELLTLTNPSVIITTEEWVKEFELVSTDLNCMVFNNKLLPLDTQIVIPESTSYEIAFLQHSSGTTGLKKGVALSHKSVIEQIASYSKAIDATSEDIVVSWLPMYHDMGLIACTIMPLVLGQTIVLLDPFEWVSKPITLFESITKHNGTLVWLPNFSFDHLRRTISLRKFEGLDLSSVRAFINCSEPCKSKTFDRFIEHFSPLNIVPEQLQVCYAMAESVYAVTQTTLNQKVRRLWVDATALLDNKVVVSDEGSGTELLSCGSVIEGCDIKILDHDTGGIVEPNVIGEVVVSGSFLFNGYYNRPKITNTVFDGKNYRTRDVGFIHNNELYLLGRIDDLIISNGRNYFAHEIERIVNDLSEVKPGRNIAIGIFNDQIGSNEIYLVQERNQAHNLNEVSEKVLIKKIREVVLDNVGLMLRDVIVVEPSWLYKSSSGKISRAMNKTKLLKFLEKD